MTYRQLYSFIYFSQEISPAQYSIYEQVEQISIIRVYSLIMQRQGSTLCNYLDEIMKSIASGDMNDESSVRYICSTFSAAINRIIHENQLQPDPVYTIPEYHADYEIPELFNQIKRCMTALCSVLDDARQTGQQQFETDVMQYIHNNIANPDLCITAITDHFGIPANELQSIIRHTQGKSFLQYIEGYRMQMAYSLICDSNITIHEISSKCGYSSQNSFYKAYRRYFGKSPSSHRI